MPKTTTYFDCEYELLSRSRARLTTPSRVYDARPSLTRAALTRLREEQLDANAYGTLLFEALLPRGGTLHQGYRECLVAARTSNTGMRFRLRLAPDLPEDVRVLEWSNIVDADEQVPLALSPEMAFSIYFHGESGPLIHDKPRLLIAIAAPPDASRYELAEIDHEQVETSLEKTLEPMGQQGYLDYEFFEGFVTIEGLRRRLDGDQFHLLHLVAHGGSPFQDKSVLVLQHENGLAHVLDENEVSNIFLGTTLRLVTLMACDGGKPSSRSLYGDLAGRLVQRGVPAVVAMRRKISFAAAERFTQCFYSALFPDGQVDVAINLARRELSLAPIQLPEWSTPVLFMRLSDGRLWQRIKNRTFPWIGSPRTWSLASIGILLVSGLLYFMGVGVGPPAPVSLSTPYEIPPLSSELLQKIHNADRYEMAGGDENTRKSLDLYREVIDELPDAYFRSPEVDREALEQAREAYSKEYYEEAAHLYQGFFDQLESLSYPP